MGCTPSMTAAEFGLDEFQFKKLVTLEEEFKIEQPTIRKFYTIFCKIDNDKSGAVSIGEFMAHFDVHPTDFGTRVFSVMDVDLSGQLDFIEFIGSVMNYCSYDSRQLLKYAFDLFDGDDSGILDMGEVNKLVEYVYGDRMDSKVRTIVSGLDKNKDGTISFKEFVTYNKNFPIMLFPAFRMQEQIRGRVLGHSFWEHRLESQKGRVLMQSDGGIVASKYDQS